MEPDGKDVDCLRMPQFEKRQAIQMAKDLVTLGLSDLDTDPCAPVYAPEPVERACRDVVNSLCQCLQYNGELNGEILQKGIEWCVYMTCEGEILFMCQFTGTVL